MRKLLLTLLTVVMSFTAFAAEPSILYERGIDKAWSEADLEDWINDTSSTTQKIDGGLSVTFGNTGWSTSKEITFQDNSIVTLTATFTGGNTGREKSFEYIDLGGVQVRMDGQAQKSYVSFDGSNWDTVDNIVLSGNPRN